VVTYYINRERENPKLLQIIINYGIWMSVIGSYGIKNVSIQKIIIKDKMDLEIIGNTVTDIILTGFME
jgi:hypothetical protein